MCHIIGEVGRVYVKFIEAGYGLLSLVLQGKARVTMFILHDTSECALNGSNVYNAE